jgi:hypothetical protein
MNFKNFVDLHDFEDDFSVPNEKRDKKREQKIKPEKDYLREDRNKHRNRVAARNLKHGDFK